MKYKSTLSRLFTVVVAMMCALGTSAVEAYAVLSNSTLTFYYDNTSHSGTKYSLNTGTANPGWKNNASSIQKVVFTESFANARPTSTYAWFSGMTNLTAITGMTYLNTSQVTTMAYMFYNSRVTSNMLDLSNFNTVRVLNMTYMFAGCDYLTTLNLSSFNTANVKYMGYMFNDCNRLTTIQVTSEWSTASVTSSPNMFTNSSRIVGGEGTTYDANHTDAEYAHIDRGVTNPGYLTGVKEAYACYTELLSKLTFYYDTLKGSRSGTIFDMNASTETPPDWYRSGTSSSVTLVEFDPSFGSARPTTTYCWFANMSRLVNIIGINYLNTSQVTNMYCMFDGCSSLTTLDLSLFNTSQATNMQTMFRGCSNLKVLDLSSFSTVNVVSMIHMFSYCTQLKTIYVGRGWKTIGPNTNPMFTDCYHLCGSRGTTYDANHTRANYGRVDGGSDSPGYFTAPSDYEPYAVFNPDNTRLTFYFDNLRSSRDGTTYDLNTGMDEPEWYTDGTKSLVTEVLFSLSFTGAYPTSTRSWFSDMTNLESIYNMSYLNTALVTNMVSMFDDCSKLTTLGLSGFRTANVTDMHWMFHGCSGLTSLDLSGFNTANVTDMSDMFEKCSELTSLDLSSFNTANVTLMDWMFKDCTGLTSLNLSSFNTTKVTNMKNMFFQCNSLESLDLSSFNTAKVTNMGGMFYSCSKLQTIYVTRNWIIGADIENSDKMFQYCNRLVGGQGTVYDNNHVDATYAHIDGGTRNPGYFTYGIGDEPYVVYTPSNRTLTFYYDKLCNSREGDIYDLNQDGLLPGWYDINYVDVSQVVFAPSFTGARPTNTESWFENMSDLTGITGIEYLNTSEVTSMFCMFSGCSSLTSLDLSGFNTANVIIMGSMFNRCSALTELDLSNFDTRNVTNMYSMFSRCSNLTTIYVGNEWSTNAVTSSSNMFKDCTSLVGGMGTTYRSNHVDASYAHIDGGSSNPGYFTAKSTALRGDVNGDGNIDVDDVTALIAAVLSGTPVDPAAADVNGDNMIDVDDVTSLIARILSGSW